MGSSPIRLEVPREDNTSLIWPSLQVRELVDAARMRRGQFPDWLASLSRLARSEAAGMLSSGDEASRFVNGTQFVDANRGGEGIIWLLGGHQPELFHPGVWFKNFLLHAMASRMGRDHEAILSLHITIDHDLAKPVSLRTTCWDSGRLLHRMRPIPIRGSGEPELPWELTTYRASRRGDWERWIDDLIEDCRTIGVQPLIGDLRERWMEALETSSHLGEAFSGFRQIVEKAFGVRNAELPMSRLCRTDAFGEFFRRLALPGSRLLEHYNEARLGYREARAIRNPVQPVPALQRHGEWNELPFWVYHKSLLIPRSKLWIRGDDRVFVLANEPHDHAAWSTQVDLGASVWSEPWRAMMDAGVCIRPRALMTTLYLRYVIADLFLHGIGGGIYDALTDEIAHRVWGVERLPMMVASASLHLPIRINEPPPLADHAPLAGYAEPTDSCICSAGHSESRWADHQRVLHRMRSAPESFLDPQDPHHVDLLRNHRVLLKRLSGLVGSKMAWHREMAELRERIRAAVEPEVQRLRLVSNDLMEAKRMQRIRRSREVPFILFPQADVAKRLKSLLPLAFD
ncbi:hypothetical protein VN12_21765 [Pirellula sp. SH-Sr6A]|uniref:hypothetical protein n=1 Tax=Pirellula sp. SH-Sr6A TaxID=1632865 RepID=UPI00078EF15F|nr:hypothetical protein [Pirellula sp. SH-Sr6A]AMV34769.1 hypothetical protein VN12_21765 [Pirellula sp. SH-Sr6A]